MSEIRDKNGLTEEEYYRFVNGETELTLKDLAFDHDDIMMDALKKA